MGEVMQESASIGLLLGAAASPKSVMELGPPVESRQIHLHIRRGGHAQGRPLGRHHHGQLALVSLVTDKRIRDRVAMTGGALPPREGPAHRRAQGEDHSRAAHKVKEIIIPRLNLKDLEEIPNYVKKGINFHPWESMRKVADIRLLERFQEGSQEGQERTAAPRRERRNVLSRG
jgi:ATP-dependent Lon protease